MKILTVKTCSDWFEFEEVEIKKGDYDEYRLIAFGTSLLWTLLCFKNGTERVKHHLERSVYTEGLVRELGINYIQGNCYQTIEGIFNP